MNELRDTHEAFLKSNEGLIRTLPQKPGWNKFAPIMEEHLERASELKPPERKNEFVSAVKKTRTVFQGIQSQNQTAKLQELQRGLRRISNAFKTIS
jgi:hypothetical protein